MRWWSCCPLIKAVKLRLLIKQRCDKDDEEEEKSVTTANHLNYLMHITSSYTYHWLKNLFPDGEGVLAQSMLKLRLFFPLLSKTLLSNTFITMRRTEGRIKNEDFSGHNCLRDRRIIKAAWEHRDNSAPIAAIKTLSLISCHLEVMEFKNHLIKCILSLFFLIKYSAMYQF